MGRSRLKQSVIDEMLPRPLDPVAPTLSTGWQSQMIDRGELV
jgi:hypothetical protein